MDSLRIKSVERKKKIKVIINGQEVIAYEGETLLATMIASGIKLIRRSSVLNEPRGGLCGMGVCYDCLVTINNVPNIRACMSYAKEGMEIITE